MKFVREGPGAVGALESEFLSTRVYVVGGRRGREGGRDGEVRLEFVGEPREERGEVSGGRDGVLEVRWGVDDRRRVGRYVSGRRGGEEVRVLDRVLELQRGAAERLHRVSRLAESTRDGLGAASRVHRGVDERRETRGRELDARRAEPRPELARQRGALGDGGQGVARGHGRRDERGDEEEREEGVEGDAAGRSTLRHDGRRRVRGSRGRLLRRRSEPGGGGET